LRNECHVQRSGEATAASQEKRTHNKNDKVKYSTKPRRRSKILLYKRGNKAKHTDEGTRIYEIGWMRENGLRKE